MRTDDVYQFFGSAKKVYEMLGISKSAFYKWCTNGCIPFKQQLKLQTFSQGKLIASRNDMPKYYRDEEVDIYSIYLPMFRYFDKKHGMCEVESIHFKKGNHPRIVYIKPGNKIERFSVFNAQNLMQAVDVKDCEGKTVYEGDICLLKTKEKFTFENMERLNKLKKLGKFKIIGNIFE